MVILPLPSLDFRDMPYSQVIALNFAKKEEKFGMHGAASPCRSWPSYTRRDIILRQPPYSSKGSGSSLRQPSGSPATNPDVEPGSNGPVTGQSGLVLALCIATEILL